MVCARNILVLGLAALWLSGSARAQGNGFVEKVVRLLSTELRGIDKRLGEIAVETRPLPDVMDEPWGSRYGHRSADLPSGTAEDWLQVDLGAQRTVDMVALMPVNLAYRGEEGAGYGFPKRFRVEISDSPDMRGAVVLVDGSGADVPNPGKYPMVFEFPQVAGRYLKFTSLKHAYDDGAYFWAMEELMAMEGNLIATAGGVLSTSSSMDLFPLWAPVRIIDGQGSLGMPVDVTEPSPTQGYLSGRLNLTEAGDPPPPPLRKWCAVDLGGREAIEQVRVLPLESEAYEVVGGRGFPRSISVQLSNDPGFGDVIWETKRGGFTLGYPAGSSINVAVPGMEARFVRVVAETMWSRDDWQVMGLSELQVFGSGRNLALGKRAFAKDAAEKEPEAGWSPAYLTDGYTSRYRLIGWPEYLRQMDRRGRLEKEKSALGFQRAEKLAMGGKLLGIGGAVVSVLVVAGWILMVVRHRILRSRSAEQLRQQIARDLHDDIGSNLGGIVLLSEIGSRHSADAESRGDFESIRRAAEDASLSMRDIVWLIQSDPVGLKDFVTRMRQSARMIVGDVNVLLEVEPADYQDRKLGLLFRRHVFLAFKEALNNVRKHAQTDRVAIKVGIGAKRMRFTVRDEGAGFDPEATLSAGMGLGNLKRRAARLAGSVRIDSAPGKGTAIVFEAPFS